MKYFTIALPLLIAYLIPGQLFAQQKTIKTVIQRFDSLDTKYPQEKIHIHFDKPYYAVGDTIWFKAYLVNQQNMLTEHSKIMYVELIDNLNAIKKSLKIPLTAGLGWGQFVLGPEYKEGNYRVRGYTQWMRNFDDAFFFDKIIPIGDVFSGNVITNSSLKSVGNKLTATIGFKNLRGIPYGSKEVSYTVYNSNKTSRGKGLTDEKGNFTTNFDVPMSGRVEVQLHIDEKTLVTKTVFFNSTAMDLLFFPEGGEMVKGLPSRIAFKAIGSDGLGRQVSGLIKNSKGEKVAEFRSEHAGMGVFALIPRAGETYTAVLDTVEQTFTLPKPADEGYLLKVNNSSDSLEAVVIASGSLVKHQQLTLVVQSKGIVLGTSDILIDRQVFTLKIPKSNMPSGIVQLTLFSEQNLPLAERLVFIDNNDNLNITEKFSKSTFAVADKIDLSFDVLNKKGQPSLGSFSIAVVNEDKIPYNELDEKSILSDLLLTSDVHGYIEQPNFYFVNTDARKQYLLDLLMLTQGWRRFTWKEARDNDNRKITYEPEQDLSVGGRLTTYANSPIADGRVDMLVKGKNGFLKTATTDQSGKFNFSDLDIEEEAEIVFKSVNQKGLANAKIKIDSLEAPLVKNWNWQDREQNVNGSMTPYLEDSFDYLEYLRKTGLLKNTTVLEEVKISTNAVSIPESANLNGPGRADFIVSGETMDRYISMYSNLGIALQSKFPNVTLNGGVAYNGRAGISMLGGQKAMTVFLDGAPLNPKGEAIDVLSSINIMDVEAIEILISIAKLTVYGSVAPAGAIIITTKKGGGRAINAADNGVVNHKAKGYSAARQFYSPVYDAAPDLKIRDLRSTIYWNPHFMTDEKGKAALSFFSAQEPGKYRFIIEGIDSNGKLGRKVFTQQIISDK